MDDHRDVYRDDFREAYRDDHRDAYRDDHRDAYRDDHRDAYRDDPRDRPRDRRRDTTRDDPRDRRSPPRRRRRGRGWLAVGIVAAIIAAVAGLGYEQLSRPLPAWAESLVMLSPAQPAGPGFTWPSVRESAVAVSGLPGAWDSGAQDEVPIASVTKMMTAYLVLRDHPLTGTDDGPALTVTAADAATYQSDVANGDSVAAVAAGESLTEREALEGLMLPSADNIAAMLADWDAGSTSSFLAKMNAEARALGMNHTDYTDPSGLAASTVSTAHDQLILVQKAMAIPAFAAIVGLQSAVIPVAGTVTNFNYDVGRDGVIGVKTGSDTAAQGCWAFAAQRVIGGTEHVVYGVVLGASAAGNSTATPALVNAALTSGVSLADQAPTVIRKVTVLPAGTLVARIWVPWSKTPVAVVTARALTGLEVPGTTVSVHVTEAAARSSFPAGQQVGQAWVTGLTGGTSSTDLVTEGASGSPSIMWRLLRR
jgi:serine-type D-Ala-D-Ala carboxypeptidase (penicillin-binding protein 5/6)